MPDPRRQIAAFQLAAARANKRGNPIRAEQCVLSAWELRKTLDGPEPIPFRRDETFQRAQAAQRAERERIRDYTHPKESK